MKIEFVDIKCFISYTLIGQLFILEIKFSFQSKVDLVKNHIFRFSQLTDFRNNILHSVAWRCHVFYLITIYLTSYDTPILG